MKDKPQGCNTLQVERERSEAIADLKERFQALTEFMKERECSECGKTFRPSMLQWKRSPASKTLYRNKSPLTAAWPKFCETCSAKVFSEWLKDIIKEETDELIEQGECIGEGGLGSSRVIDGG